ncbi:iron transporter [Halobacteria archaeon AArc-curdl1]|uniref:Iron transporter n=1 Tax=Natronosalvus hydrolyticus TaxID=2979988 RepID=A0AAP3E6W9_9EURY|nr:iron transporter [Halobacteria archaeon AArc-curdl1]
MYGEGDVSRRGLLCGWVGAGALALAGCLEDDTTDAVEGNGDEGEETIGEDGMPAFPEIENPPDVVYRPTHREEMVMLEPVEAGPYLFGPMLTYPHPFWLTQGRDVQRVDPSASDDVHLMVTAWDRETGLVVPLDSSPVFELFYEDASIEEERPWLMISQQMGFHFGDNVALGEDGTYRVEGRVSPPGVRRTGAFTGRFEDTVSFSFEFEFGDELRNLVTEIDYFPEEEWGESGALEPMDHGGNGHDDHESHDDHNDSGHDPDEDDHHEHDDHHAIPYSALPPADELPGTHQASLESGDAVFEVTLLESGSRFVDDDSWYLAVSPRSPYNRCVLPLMALEAVVDGETHQLIETMDDELHHHYGIALEGDPDGASLDLEVVTPPQVTRHQGYETAFLEMPSMSTELSR